MPGSRERHSDHPAGLARRELFLITIGLALSYTAAAGAAPSLFVHLPTSADAIAFAPNSQTLLFGLGGIETKRPGPISDAEAVTVGLDADGTPDAVQVVQRLTVFGLGDFEIRVPGPAQDVRALPESAEQPGLRKGAVLWQGFSPGRKVLAAAMDLFPDQEAQRLPLRFALAIAVDGEPLRPGMAASGALDLAITVSNVSAIPIAVQGGRADPVRLAPVLDAVRDALTHGRRPEPGRGGVPTQVPALGPVTSRAQRIEAPFRVAGELAFPPGTLADPQVRGAMASQGSDGTRVAFAGLLGGGSPLTLSVHVTGRANALSLPSLDVTAVPALPSAGLVRPPSGASWRQAVATASSPSGEAMLARLLSVLWRTARIKQYEQYLGNPDPLGASSTTYTFRLAPPTQHPAAAPASRAHQLSALGALGLALVGSIVLLGAALAWARS